MTSTPRSFLILHGWQNHRPKDHWQHWLADELTAGGDRVTYPQLPEPDRPDLGAWLARLRELMAADERLPRGEHVVVCHSLGALLWLQAAARGGIRADRVLLVAPPAAEVLDRHEEIAAFARPAATAAHVRAAAGRTGLVAGDNDAYCPGGAAHHYGHPLALDTDVIPGAAHLDLDAGYGPWPSLLAWAHDPAVRISARPPTP
ncbi:RBBP9/YdeN family alpha/beta hydrolase [Actinacidiphila sp. ITFR-21]|uniref:RBBP9/YdeN family alpha/beta hydrolase n=1 Tax=Actinacidiphila sp. ITFR-21 TaxID=3075199 RepID=UPI002889BCAB|nr:alpha/beta hydrolase [Streptomyces sp. ITFR-21]WNI18627.1 alpha/beta hydrolase [Streptomyces sp. ITFR-21]